MDAGKKQSIVDRLLTGIVYLKVGKHLYKLNPPTSSQRALADLFYHEALEEVKYSDFISRSQAKVILAKSNTWTPQHEKQLENLQKYLEDQKILLYKALYNKKEQKKIRRRIKELDAAILRSLEKQYSMEFMTFEYHAENLKRDFLIALRITGVDDKPIYTYDNFWESDGIVMRAFSKHINKTNVSTEDMREIVRTEPFRSYWGLGKENMLGIPAKDFNEEQKTAILYSRMYDSAYEHPERPSEEVIEDDLMLDGWIAKCRRESDKARSQKEAEDLLGTKGVGAGQGGEMFVVANSPEEADKIKELNDINGRMTMDRRRKAILEQGKLEEHQLPDVKLDLQRQAMRQMADNMKGKK